MKSKEKSLSSSLLQLTSTICAIIYTGWVLTMLWGWFVISVFFMMPVLSIPMALGLFAIGKVVTFKYPTAEDLAKSIKQVHTEMWVKPTLFLVFGFVVSLFM